MGSNFSFWHMPGRFFDDLLEDCNERMGYDPYEDPNDTDPWKEW